MSSRLVHTAVSQTPTHHTSNYPPVRNKEINRHPENNHSASSLHGLSSKRRPQRRVTEGEEGTPVKTWLSALQPGSPGRGSQRNQWDTDTGIC